MCIVFLVYASVIFAYASNYNHYRGVDCLEVQVFEVRMGFD